ncbi:MAG: C40 family peptidase [Solirubrobacteraceae bacterium]
MSLQAVLARVDQILAYQQALVDPALLTPASSSSSASGFAGALASAQSQPSTSVASDALSQSALMPLTPGAPPTLSGMLGAGATTPALGMGATTAVPGAAGVAGANSGLQGAVTMLTAARAALGGAYNQANHNAVSDSASQIQQQGTDCSGFVSYLMGPNGIGDWSQSYATPGIPTAPGIQPGAGSYVTIWNNPNPGDAGHVWIEILGQYFESSGSGGVHQMSQSEANAYLSSGQYQPFHPIGM